MVSRPRSLDHLLVWATLVLAIVSACGGSEPEPAADAPRVDAARDEPGPVPDPAASSDPGAASDPAASSQPAAALPTVVFLGDSLTAGFQLAEEQAWPALVAERLAAEGLPFRAVNAGVSGDTSAGGLARLDWVLRAGPDVVVVELGANDALRGQDLASTEANLRRIVERLRGEEVAVLLVGLEIPPNYGPDYARSFTALFPRLAAEYHLPLVPFLLERVAAERSLNLADGIHPNAEGHRIVAETVAPHLRPLVAAAAEGPSEAAK
jgi:acyl-CoA thioesterase I